MDVSFSKFLNSQKTTDFLLRFLVIEVIASMLYIILSPNTTLLP